MSCSSCGSSCSPCHCDECDSNNEPLASALNNFITAFFGSLTKTCVDGKVVWVLPCNLEAGIAEFPRNSGEGIACYFLRLAEYLRTLEPTPPVPPVPPEPDCCCFIPDNTIIVDNVCYTTWQSAYNAALTVLGDTVAMYIGRTSDPTPLGDLNLTANFDSRIRMVGMGKNNSELGNINAINSGNGFNVVFTAKEVSIGNINTYTTDTTGTFNGGDITITGEGIFVMEHLNTSALTGNIGGKIQFFNHETRMGHVDTRGQKGGGDFITSINKTYGTYGGQSLNIDTRSMVSGAAGNVIIGDGFFAQSIDARAIGTGSGGIINIRRGGFITGNIARGTVSPGEMQLEGCYIYNQIDNIGSGCKFKDVLFHTESANKNNIQEVVSNGALFTGCFFITHGLGVPIQASVPRTIISHFTVSQKALGANVTVSSGTFTVESGLDWDKDPVP